MRTLVAFALLMVAALPSRADDFTERAAAAKDTIYLSAPALTAETCQALVDAEARKVYIYLVIEPTKRFACDAHNVSRLLFFTLDHIPSAFVSLDGRHVGKGPDIEHLTFTYDPLAAAYLLDDFWNEAFQSPRMAEYRKH